MEVLNMHRLTMQYSEIIIHVCVEKWRQDHILTIEPYFNNIHKRKAAIV